jgi:hypothetical protein
VYGNGTDIPVMGDWNGDGIDTPGVIRGDHWYLSNTFNATVDYSFAYGIAGDKIVVGDWDGNGTDTPGVVRGHTWYLSNSFGGNGDYIFGYGNDTDLAIVGDWDGNGTDTPAVIRGDEWWLSNDFAGNVSNFFKYGIAGDKFVAGDWDGDGVDSPGAVRGHTWYLSNVFGGSGDYIFGYGNDSDRAVVGDFNNDGVDTYGVFRSAWWYCRNDYDPTNSQPPDTPPGTPDYSEPTEDYPDGAAAQFQTASIPIYAQFAPQVRLHPNEQYWPARVIAYFLRNAELKWSYSKLTEQTLPNAGFGQVEPRRLGIGSGTTSYIRLGCSGYHWFRSWDLTRPYESGRTGCLGGGPEGFFLNLRDSARPGEPNNLANVPVYFEFLSGRYVQYYFFYANDDAQPINFADHEGDWERIAIDLDASNQPVQVAYYTHGCDPKIYSWANVPKVNGTHPIVWSAKGTHGSWHEVGDGSRDTCNSVGGVGEDQLSDSGPRWNTWTHMVNANQAPWYGFGGAWGERGNFATSTGPLGPYPGKKQPPAGW